MKFKLFNLLIVLLSFLDVAGQATGVSSLYWSCSTKAHEGYQDRALANSEEFQAFSLHQGSYYLQANTTYNLSDSETFDNQIQIEGALTTNIIPAINLFGTTINVPIRGNIFALLNQDSTTSFEGGIYPFAQIPDKAEKTDLFVHGGFEGQWTPTQAEGMQTNNRAWRGFFGLELVYFFQNKKTVGETKTFPIVIGAAGVVENPIIGDQNNVGAEFTLNLQIVPGFTGIARYYQRIDGLRQSGAQIGIGISSANLAF